MTETKPPSSPSPFAPDGAAAAVPSGVHAMRRGGVRHEVTERVTFRFAGGRVLTGWALNISRGGLRAILEERVALGQKFELTMGGAEAIERSGRIVWIQAEPDGVIVGVEFTGSSGTHPSVPPPPPGAESVPRLEAHEALPLCEEPGTPSEP